MLAGPVPVADPGVTACRRGAEGRSSEPAGDREQPGPRRRAAGEPGQAAHRPPGGLLGQVLGLVPAAVVDQELTHVTLGGADERRQCHAVAGAGCERQRGHLLFSTSCVTHTGQTTRTPQLREAFV